MAGLPRPPHTQTGALSARPAARTAQAAAPPTGPVGQLDAEGPAPSSQQRRGRCPRPAGEVGRWGRMPPPPAASVRGALSTPPGVGAAATRCQTPWGTEPYTSTSAPPALDLHPALHFRKRRTLRPSCLLLSPARSSLGCGVEETGDLHPLGYRGALACSTEGPAPVRSPDPVGHTSVEAPQQGGLGARSFSFQLP